MPNAVIAHAPDGKFDLDALEKEAREWPGLVGMDLVPMVTSGQRFTWDETPWEWGKGYGRQDRPDSTWSRSTTASSATSCGSSPPMAARSRWCRRDLGRRHRRAQARWRLPVERPRRSGGDRRICGAGDQELIDQGIPTFGICLGHQMLGIAVGAKTMKMHQGHHGANHPVKDLTTGKVEITSMNHGFTVDRATLPANAMETHVSLFDGSNCGIALKDKPVFSVQYHPEASPGPRDSRYLFERFVGMMKERKRA